MRSDTIFALSTAPGRAGVAVVRVSGPRAGEAAALLTGRPPPAPRLASLRRLRDIRSGELIDEGLVLYFARGGSFTGEEVVEFQIHGGNAAVDLLLEALDGAGLRAAEPGEFTRRAFANGRIDLSQVEGLADLIDAETRAQHDLALRLADGALSRRTEAWREALVGAMALIEAAIDFSDEELPEGVLGEASAALSKVRAETEAELAGAAASEILRRGFEVAIVGAPNAGKSSLLNALARREAALVSAVPGTTRDVIEVHLDLGGMAVTFLDTAGQREADDEVERMGVALAKRRAEAADLRIVLECPGADWNGRVCEEDLLVSSKADLRASSGRRGMPVSSLTGKGVAELLDAVSQRAKRKAAGASSVSHLRQRRALESAAARLREASAAGAEGEEGLELAAESVRLAVRALDELSGRSAVEDVLDKVFGRFCLGK